MSDDILRVNELFASIQGESTHAGRLCYFVRLAGCNLRCSYCDTEYAQSLDSGRPYTVDKLLATVKSEHPELVEITGGEPLLQEALPRFIRGLLDSGIEVLVETNGSLPIRDIPEGARRILDCKLPSSGMSRFNLIENYQFLTSLDEVKFVIGSREDYEFATRMIHDHDLVSRTRNLLFSPVWDALEFETLAQWMIADRSAARMQLQMHKLIWGRDAGGV